MKTLIHDLNEEEFKIILSNTSKDLNIISNNETINKCIGCFGCWIKTPATCVIKDDYKDMGGIISKSEELIIISKCTYGGYSPFVKNVLDRSISYIHPYFTIREGKMHHKSRYKAKIKLKVLFYSENITSQEKETAKKLVAAHCVNFNASSHEVYFYNNIEDLRGDIL